MMLAIAGVAQASAPVAQHVSGNVPVQGSGQALAAERPLAATVATPLAPPAGHDWQLQATLPGTVIHDLSFASPSVGYAAAELGQVWKTSNGGKTWTEILNLGSPTIFTG